MRWCIKCGDNYLTSDSPQRFGSTDMRDALIYGDKFSASWDMGRIRSGYGTNWFHKFSVVPYDVPPQPEQLELFPDEPND